MITQKLIASGEEYGIYPGLEYELAEGVIATLQKATPNRIQAFNAIGLPDMPEPEILVPPKKPDKEDPAILQKWLSDARKQQQAANKKHQEAFDKVQPTLLKAWEDRVRIAYKGIPNDLDFNEEVDTNMLVRMHNDFLLMSRLQGSALSRSSAGSSKKKAESLQP